MKAKLPLLVFLAVILIPLSSATAGTDLAPEASLRQLMDDIEAKLRTRPVDEHDLAEELNRFDMLLERYRGLQTPEVAEILFTKGTLYLKVFRQPDRAKEILEQLIRDFPGTPQVAKSQVLLDSMKAEPVAASTDEALAVGMPFPDFEETDTEGRLLSVRQYHCKVVLVEFWAMWCGPCLGELPNVISTYDRYHDRGFEIIGISLDPKGTDRKLAKFTAEKGMPWPEYFDGGYWQTKLAVKYGVRAIPTSYLIDRDGRVAAVNLRGRALAAAVARLVAED